MHERRVKKTKACNYGQAVLTVDLSVNR